MKTEMIRPKGKLFIEVIDNKTNEVEKELRVDNMMMNGGIEALSMLLVAADSGKKVDKLVYGDGAHLRTVVYEDNALNRKVGELEMKSSISQHILERSVTMIFSIEFGAGAPTKLINELGLLCADGETLFAYVDLTKINDVLLFEAHKKINVYWKYLWV